MDSSMQLTLLHIYDCAGSSLLSGLFYSCSLQASCCSGFSCCLAWTLGSVGFTSCGSRAVEHRLNSCGPWASLLLSLWDPLRSGIKPMSPVLAGGFFTTEPPGKLPYCTINAWWLIWFLLVDNELSVGKSHVKLAPRCNLPVTHINVILGKWLHLILKFVQLKNETHK